MLDVFKCDALSPREHQVARMILKGHSSMSISLNLDIALPTVKTHRKNIYAKLGIATQSELMGLFLDGINKAGKTLM
ncbi:Response regulator protein TodT [compost metagenome]